MTVVEHLDELRYRLVVSILAFGVCTIVAWFFYRPILEFLSGPIDQANLVGNVKVDLFVSGVVGPFMLRLKTSAFAGLMFSLPVTLYQLWRFITPGLMANEKKYAIPFVGTSVGLFAMGVWFALLVLPKGVTFLLGFIEPGIQQPLITFQDYLKFVTLMILAFGITFEIPLLLVFLAMVGVVSSQTLRRFRRYAVFAAFVIAAVATPSGDPFSQLAMAGPLYILYEASILVIRFVLKK